MLYYHPVMETSLYRIKNKYSHLGYAILLVWLFALFSHATHNETISQSDRDVACHMCQNSLDNNDEVVPQTASSPRVYRTSVLAETPLVAEHNNHIRLNLRAPPQFYIS